MTEDQALILILSSVSIIINICLIRYYLITQFKISYYEGKLENRDVDISHVKDLGLIGVFMI